MDVKKDSSGDITMKFDTSREEQFYINVTGGCFTNRGFATLYLSLTSESASELFDKLCAIFEAKKGRSTQKMKKIRKEKELKEV